MVALVEAKARNEAQAHQCCTHMLHAADEEGDGEAPCSADLLDVGRIGGASEEIIEAASVMPKTLHLEHRLNQLTSYFTRAALGRNEGLVHILQRLVQALQGLIVQRVKDDRVPHLLRLLDIEQ